MLFTFPSRYWFTIGRFRKVALEGGPPSFPQGFTCLVVLRKAAIVCRMRVRDGAFTRCGVGFQRLCVRIGLTMIRGPLQPRFLRTENGLGSCPVRSPLLRASRLISLRRTTEMFQFAHALRLTYLFSEGFPDMTLEGLPHSDTQGSSLGCSSP